MCPGKMMVQLNFMANLFQGPCPEKMMVQLNFMANLFQGPILLIWSMMSLDIIKAVNLQVGKLLQKV